MTNTEHEQNLLAELVSATEQYVRLTANEKAAWGTVSKARAKYKAAWLSCELEELPWSLMHKTVREAQERVEAGLEAEKND